ncbi:class D sortase [Bacillus tuaregi]|uniref:class D sortase n=1 Tax=Bacillus tuaregi TaxID=1816695 RepID=UPI0008F926C9|nr:class D sortase [Bacillus tuaregi]
MKKLGNIFILIGMALLIFVVYSKVQTYMEQKKLMEEYTSLAFSQQSNEEDKLTLQSSKKGDTIGILHIPEIGLETPIVEGADLSNIKFAVGHLPSSGSMKDLGEKNHNFAIAGHRSYIYGKYFNRLDELKENNKVIIYIGNKEYTYKVVSKEIVEPTDVEVVKPVKGQSLVTLITCHPKNSDKKRLIVFGEYVSERTFDGHEITEKLKL